MLSATTKSLVKSLKTLQGAGLCGSVSCGSGCKGKANGKAFFTTQKGGRGFSNSNSNAGSFGSGFCLCCGTPSFLCNYSNFKSAKNLAILQKRDLTSLPNISNTLPKSANETAILLKRNVGTTTRKSFLQTGPEGTPPNAHLRDILENNRKWAENTTEKDPEFFDNLKQGQAPKYLYIGCSDSRVPANQILGLGPGEVFVHRNVGNLVPGQDLNALSVIEYAVFHLHVTDIIVVGHYQCGAVRAATSRQDLGLLEHWLRHIRDVYRIHKDYLDLIVNEEDRHYSLVELNVIEQCLNIYKLGVVQRKRMENRDNLMKNLMGGYNKNGLSEKEQLRVARGAIDSNDISPRIHGLVFNPGDGLLKPLAVDFQKRIGSLDHIYGLYDTRPNPNKGV